MLNVKTSTRSFSLVLLSLTFGGCVRSGIDGAFAIDCDEAQVAVVEGAIFCVYPEGVRPATCPEAAPFLVTSQPTSVCADAERPSPAALRAARDIAAEAPDAGPDAGSDGGPDILLRPDARVGRDAQAPDLGVWIAG